MSDLHSWPKNDDDLKGLVNKGICCVWQITKKNMFAIDDIKSKIKDVKIVALFFMSLNHGP